MLPRVLQSALAAGVPALVATFGLASVRAAVKAGGARSLLAAGVLAMIYGALTIANLSVQGGVPFSSGATGYGPRSVAVDFLASAAFVGAALSWATAALLAHGEARALRKPLLVALAIGGLVVVGFLLLETFG